MFRSIRLRSASPALTSRFRDALSSYAWTPISARLTDSSEASRAL